MSVCMCVYFVCTKDRSQGFLQSVVVDGFFMQGLISHHR